MLLAGRTYLREGWVLVAMLLLSAGPWMGVTRLMEAADGRSYQGLLDALAGAACLVLIGLIVVRFRIGLGKYQAAELIVLRGDAAGVYRRMRLALVPVCLACGYDLRRLGHAVCPECGHDNDLDAPLAVVLAWPYAADGIDGQRFKGFSELPYAERRARIAAYDQGVYARRARWLPPVGLLLVLMVGLAVFGSSFEELLPLEWVFDSAGGLALMLGVSAGMGLFLWRVLPRYHLWVNAPFLRWQAEHYAPEGGEEAAA